MDSSFLSSFSGSSTKPLLEYSGEGTLVHVGSGGDNSDTLPELDIISNFKSDGFSDFELDLSCLSNPPSPLREDMPLASSAHVGALELSSPSPPSEPKQSPSLPFFSSSPPNRDPTPSPKMTPLELLKNSSNEPRNSWPLIKYVGRGTPIDPNRRIEWGHGSNNDDVPNEHGVLFSSSSNGGGRANSLDSAVRSSSQEWHHVASPSHNRSHSHTLSGPPRALSPLLQLTLDMSPLDPLPETSKLQVKGIESDPDEWTSVMDTVMKSSGGASGSGSGSAGTSGSGNADTSAGPSPPVKDGDEPSAQARPTDIAMFGLDTAVDLGLGLGTGMNFFNLGLAPGTSDVGHGHSIHRASTTGRDSPSVYSTAPPTPEGLSPPESVAVNDEKEKGEGREGRDGRPSEVRERRNNVDDDEEEDSTAAIGTPTTGSAQYNAHEHHHRVSQWWRKIFTQLRKLQLALRVSHRRRD
ncbi:hypothetical protein PQX77_016038 [Marasmius sp. AFHP31]|nr:hypothetical protein PQX77_016038 [Marasmius sp. AFHP31]